MDHLKLKLFPNSYVNKIFPPPGFLKMPAAGVDISDNVIRYVELGTKNGKNYVKYFGAERLPAGVITSGYINDSAQVAKALEKIRDETDILFVNVSLPEEKAYLFEMQVPTLPGEELFEAVGFRLEENAPVSAKEVIYDFSILKNGKEVSDHQNVMVSVIPSKVSETYAEVVRGAGFTPLAFEVSSQAVSRAAVNFRAVGSYLVMNMGEMKTGFSVVCNGDVLFTSTVPFGSAMLDEIATKTYGVSRSQFEEIKTEIIGSGKQDMKMFVEIMESTTLLKEEIKKIANYWRSHGASRGSGKIDKIILCGRDSIIPSFNEYLQTVTGIRTEVANVWQNVFSFEDYIPPISREDSLDYAGAIGLALIK